MHHSAGARALSLSDMRPVHVQTDMNTPVHAFRFVRCPLYVHMHTSQGSSLSKCPKPSTNRQRLMSGGRRTQGGGDHRTIPLLPDLSAHSARNYHRSPAPMVPPTPPAIQISVIPARGSQAEILPP